MHAGGAPATAAGVINEEPNADSTAQQPADVDPPGVASPANE
jgi:hypothetical protein